MELRKPNNFDPQAALNVAIDASSTRDIQHKLRELQFFLEQRRSPRAVARHFGWDQQVRGFIVPTTIMATYCWLRYPSDFRRAVESAVMLSRRHRFGRCHCRWFGRCPRRRSASPQNW
ncbi:MAG: ADP-ribosylglycohydrolase family protein [Pirellulaceae bacterium]